MLSAYKNTAYVLLGGALCKAWQLIFSCFSLCALVKRCLEKEIEKGKIRKIYALKLGYCVYFSDEGKNIYTIYPVWMCECDYTESAKEELKKSEQIPDERKQYYYKQLVMNAQTGQIEPYLIEKQELAYCPRVITWENTQ